MLKVALGFIVYDKTKFIGIVFGIVISIFLVGVQLGFLNSVLLDTFLGIAKDNTEYIFVVDKKTTSSMSLVNIDKRVGYELQSIDGVEGVYPVIVIGVSCKYASGATGVATVIGVQFPLCIGGAKHFTSGTDLNDLQHEGAVILDISDLENMENIKVGDHFYLNDSRVYVCGLSLNNQNIGQPNIITTIERARQISNFSMNHVSAYLVKSKSNESGVLKRIVQIINATIPHVNAYTGQDFADESLEYVKKTSTIIGSFIFLVAFSLVTGLVVVGLTMFSSVNDRIRDYGTVKAIGGTNEFIIKLILTQSIIYSVIGFVIAMAMLFSLRYLMISSNQRIEFSPSLIAFLILSTLVISLAASYFSLRKILKLEPNQIFRM